MRRFFEIDFTKACIVFLWITILVVNIFRFQFLDKAPNGFHVDEMSYAVTVQCLATEGKSIHGDPYPIFSDVGYGTPRPATTVYPSIVWSRIFGFTPASFRSLSVFMTVLSLLGLFILGLRFFDLLFATILVMLASISPWMWPVSRLSLETPFYIFYSIWAVYFLSKSKNSVLFSILTGIFVSFALYTYPAARLFIPLSLIPVLMIFFRMKMIDWKAVFISAGVTLVVSIPLMWYLVFGNLMSRFNKIGIFSQVYWDDIGKVYNFMNVVEKVFSNFMLHFSFRFLFQDANVNLPYSAGRFVGILGWLDVFGIMCGLALLILYIFKKKACPGSLIGILYISVILFGFLPSAFTWHDIPNSLRIISAWPFVMGILAYFIWRLSTKRWGNIVLTLFLVISILFSFSFLKYYFTRFGPNSRYIFYEYYWNDAEKIKTDVDWLNFIAKYRRIDYYVMYFLMNYRGDTCTEAWNKWNIVNTYVNQQK